MKKNVKVILVLMDAFRSTYISSENTPFLHHLSQKHVYHKHVIPTRSFCERSEIFSGLTPVESGYFTAIGFDPEDSPYRNMWWISFFFWLEKIIPKNIFHRVYKRALNKVLKRVGNGMSAYDIPIKILKFFNLTEDKYDFWAENNSDGIHTIFDDCRNSKLKVFLNAFTSLNSNISLTDDQRIEIVKSEINESYNFYPLYISTMDSIAHKYGPDSKNVEQELKSLDHKLEKFYSEIKKINSNVKFMFLGDHGMTKVKNHIDINEVFREFSFKTGLSFGKDFIYFLDSTVMRVWLFNDKARTDFENHILNATVLNHSGSFVTEEIAKREHIPLGDIRYGDYIWLANIGTLIYPDFFHSTRPYHGMHGYDVNDISSQGMSIIDFSDSRNEFINSSKLTEMYGVLKDLLEVDL